MKDPVQPHEAFQLRVQAWSPLAGAFGAGVLEAKISQRDWVSGEGSLVGEFGDFIGPIEAWRFERVERSKGDDLHVLERSVDARTISLVSYSGAIGS